MSDEINNGGPAFPKTGYFKPELEAVFDSENQDGMTLRDYFAAKAMQGMVSTVKFLKEAEGLNPDPLAVAAYEIADAMLEAREFK